MSRIRRWVPVITVIAILGAAMVAAVHAPPSFELADPPPRPNGAPPSAQSEPFEAIETPPPAVPPSEGDTTLPPWVGTLLTVLCAAAVVALVGTLLWFALRDRLQVRTVVPAIADPEEVRRRVREQVRAAVEEGLSDLDVSDTDPRRAVIACWARLEAAAAAAGTQRGPGDTSTELVERLLTEHAMPGSREHRSEGQPRARGASASEPRSREQTQLGARSGPAGPTQPSTASVLAGFAAVYREARFATHVIDVQMREEARAALIQVRDELLRGAPARSTGGAT